MLVHGAWLSSGSWDNFAGFFRDRGFDVSAPEWPRKEGEVAELREASEDIKGLGITEIVDHYASEIEALDQPPVLVGTRSAGYSWSCCWTAASVARVSHSVRRRRRGSSCSRSRR
jgi:hypothetical protein